MLLQCFCPGRQDIRLLGDGVLDVLRQGLLLLFLALVESSHPSDDVSRSRRNVSLVRPCGAKAHDKQFECWCHLSTLAVAPRSPILSHWRTSPSTDLHQMLMQGTNPRPANDPSLLTGAALLGKQHTSTLTRSVLYAQLHPNRVNVCAACRTADATAIDGCHLARRNTFQSEGGLQMFVCVCVCACTWSPTSVYDCGSMQGLGQAHRNVQGLRSSCCGGCTCMQRFETDSSSGTPMVLIVIAQPYESLSRALG